MKKVLFYSKHDWANSGYKTCEAVKRHSSEYVVKYFAEMPHPFGYDRGRTLVTLRGNKAYINHDVVADMADWAKECDIIHFKGDEGIYTHVYGVDLDLSKPVVMTVCGIGWERNHKEIWDKSHNFVNQLLATTPDHLQHGIEGRLMPLPIDTLKYSPISKSSDCIVIGHSPTCKRKGTEMVTRVVQRVQQEYDNIFFNLQQQIPFNFTIELKRINHIFVDQINDLGIYSNNAVESMALGSVTIASDKYGATGMVHCYNEEQLYYTLLRFIEDRNAMTVAQNLALQFIAKTHSYPIVAKKLTKVYDEVLG